MTSSAFQPPQRIGYFDGQLLAARDLQDQADGESRLRGLNVRALHNTWGVALGFEIVRSNALLLQVGPGIAYDARGREIISAHTLNVGPPVPPAGTEANAWWFDLVIGYRQPLERSPGEIGCFEGLRPGEEQPVWRWCYAGEAPAGAPSPLQMSREVRLGEEVPLVRCRVDAKPGFGEALDFTVRRQAQGMVRPHVGGGRLSPFLSWDASRSAFTTVVNTAAAGFSRTPFYFARITIPQLFGPDVQTRELRSLLGPFVSVEAPARTSFRLNVRAGFSPVDVPVGIAAEGGAASPRAVVVTPRLRVDLNWAGVEPNGGCVPGLQLLSSIFLYRPYDLFINRMTPGYATWSAGVNNG